MELRVFIPILVTTVVICVFALFRHKSLEEDEFLRSVDPLDGIRKEEAEILASAYFREFYGLCGATILENETEDCWYFTILFGYAAEELKNPLIVRKDGSNIGASYAPAVFYSNGSWKYSRIDYLRRDPIKHMNNLAEERAANKARDQIASSKAAHD